MPHVQVMDVQKTDGNGRPVLRLTVRGHTVEAVFLAEPDTSTLPSVKTLLLDTYIRRISGCAAE